MFSWKKGKPKILCLALYHKYRPRDNYLLLNKRRIFSGSYVLVKIRSRTHKQPLRSRGCLLNYFLLNSLLIFSGSYVLARILSALIASRSGLVRRGR